MIIKRKKSIRIIIHIPEDLSIETETKKNTENDNDDPDKNNETVSEPISDTSYRTFGEIVDLGGQGKSHYYPYDKEETKGKD
jgi:hypothetical protein